MLTDATEEVGVDLGIAGVAEAGPSTHEDNLIILHELDIKEDDDDEDEEQQHEIEEDDDDGEEEEDEDDEDDHRDQEMCTEGGVDSCGVDQSDQQQQAGIQGCSITDSVQQQSTMEQSLCTNDLDGFDGINAIKMETDSIFDSGGKSFLGVSYLFSFRRSVCVHRC